jgi:cyclic pyranopterin phosphate synthase
MTKFTHFDESGAAHMVDIGAKLPSERLAIAEGFIEMHPETVAMIEERTHKKGDVLGIARIAGIMASKRTAELIPLCHPVALSHVSIELEAGSAPTGIHCKAVACTTGPTGVEMEALTAVHVTLLTIYDMCKAVDRGMTMHSIRLLEKSGGRSGHWLRSQEP